jgi:hypothetical protein
METMVPELKIRMSKSEIRNNTKITMCKIQNNAGLEPML